MLKRRNRMIDAVNNPWAEMHADAVRRIDSGTIHDFYWVKDPKSKYGLLIKFAALDDEQGLITRIQGLTIIRRAEDSRLELYMLVNSNDDREMFLTLCNDLIKVSADCYDPDMLLKTINARLKRWQKFLSQGKDLSMTEPRQMGLITELNFLINVLTAKTSLAEAITSWVGPEFDRQDFSAGSIFIEIKSFISSKGPFIRVSSLHQLNFRIKPLYLMAYPISRNDSGNSIIDLIIQIRELFTATDQAASEEFENKLAQYGYLEGITEAPFYKWIIGSGTFYTVDEKFPKILAGEVADQITAVEYTIDLSRCRNFETDLNSIDF